MFLFLVVLVYLCDLSLISYHMGDRLNKLCPSKHISAVVL